MSELDTIFNEATKPSGTIQGAILTGVNKTGITYSKRYGRNAIESDASPISNNGVFKVASCTKLITTIAALQCVERGLISLGESVYKILPEISDLPIIHTPDEGKTISFTKPTKEITLRMLLTHSSGLAYDGMSPASVTWRAERGQEPMVYPISGTVPECYATPLLFEPGEGWIYGSGLDWAGYLVRRLNGNISLRDYFTTNIFEPVGRTAPFPTFDISDHPDMKARLVTCYERTEDGGLKEAVAPFGENALDEHGGSGLALTVPDYCAVLSDLLKDEPKLLKPETVKQMFTSQFQPDSPALQGLLENSYVWLLNTGGVPPPEASVNYGLGGLLLLEGVPELNIPANTLTWSGYTSPVWMVNRDRGIGGFFATQMLPPGDPKTGELIAAYWKEHFGKDQSAS
ncbi:beta-lactamase/transpeptidase-like protein [Microthyrium microscopicum]|uniref:Beta-lactamase/transpeptidase-like protein n=1 Tax=Microthyrium microscopicum TaxID=703497 RepID=A0A6A6U7D9_9PEZI|nr:beta-lactamase/transpeptidase-like protein [Microthyrium microscopicum]